MNYIKRLLSCLILSLIGATCCYASMVVPVFQSVQVVPGGFELDPVNVVVDVKSNVSGGTIFTFAPVVFTSTPTVTVTIENVSLALPVGSSLCAWVKNLTLSQVEVQVRYRDSLGVFVEPSAGQVNVHIHIVGSV